MKRNYSRFKAFTIIELMVSIFITMIVTASLYKLYNVAARSERSTAIRVSVNLLGEQILDTIAESVRFIGLNSDANDFDNYNTAPDTSGIMRRTEEYSFRYLSPYSGPVTKLKTDASGTYPICTFTIFNSAAFNNNITSFYLHTQDGVFETTKADIGEGYAIAYNSYSASYTTSGFEREAKSGLTGKDCKDIFPAGTLISGSDKVFYLAYNSGTLLLYSLDPRSPNDATPANSDYLVRFSPPATGSAQTYRMPKFSINYLVEKTTSTTTVTSQGTITTKNIERNWKANVDAADRKDIIAVRFGFVIISERERGKVSGNMPGTSNTQTYCVFGDGEGTAGDPDCYQLTNPNYTGYVFRRVVYLSNHRLLKDQKDQPQ